MHLYNKKIYKNFFESVLLFRDFIYTEILHNLAPLQLQTNFGGNLSQNLSLNFLFVL